MGLHGLLYLVVVEVVREKKQKETVVDWLVVLFCLCCACACCVWTRLKCYAPVGGLCLFRFNLYLPRRLAGKSLAICVSRGWLCVLVCGEAKAACCIVYVHVCV